MSITSTRTLQIGFSGNISSQIIQSALENEVSPGEIEILSLADSNNTIGPPDVDGIVVTGVTIIPPAGNTVQMTLKGVAGDTGILLHLTDPTSIALSPDQASFVIEAEDEIVGVRLIWS